MKKIYAKLPLLLLLVITFSNGCQKEELMMSENKISEQISYTWSKQFTSDSQITWQFKDGKIYIRQNENLSGQGTYTVECSLTKAKVRIDGFSGGNDFMNMTWQVLKLNDKILVVTDLNKGTLVNEFIRKD